MLRVTGNGMICSENKRGVLVHPSFVAASRADLRLARKRMRLEDTTIVLLHYQLVLY